MPFPRALLLLGLATAAWPAGAGTLPPVQGALQGSVSFPALRGAPPLDWHLQVAPAPSGELRLTGTARASGLEVVAEITVPADDRAGTWKVVRGTCDLAALPATLKPMVGSKLPADLVLGGTVQLSGGGTWRGDNYEGTIELVLPTGTAASATQGWEAGALALSARFNVTTAGVTLASCRLSAATVLAAGIMAKDVVVEAAGEPDGRIGVRRAELTVFDGRVIVAPFAVDPAQPVINATAQLAGLALAEVAKLLPDTLAGAQGRLDGRISVLWSQADGFQPRAGALRVTPGTAATLRLARTPGFLTQHVPARFQLLPPWLRLPEGWFAPVNPAYGTLERIELGREELAVEALNVALYPDGPDAPRSAVVEVAARPATDSLVEKVTFTVNVAGPLQQVLRFGMDNRARLNFSAGKK